MSITIQTGLNQNRQAPSAPTTPPPAGPIETPTIEKPPEMGEDYNYDLASIGFPKLELYMSDEGCFFVYDQAEYTPIDRITFDAERLILNEPERREFPCSQEQIAEIMAILQEHQNLLPSD